MKTTEKERAYNRKWYQEHKEKEHIRAKKYRQRIIGKWLHLFPKNPKCGICGKNLAFFNKRNKCNNHACFDHKTENLPIGGSPYAWLRDHSPTLENKKIWKSCKFGVLCNRCNRNLPAKNRIKWLKKANQYMGLIVPKKRK